MIKVTICVCTFRNPEGLRALLQGLDRQLLATADALEVLIAVIDNDVGCSAGDVLNQYLSSGRFKLRGATQPRRGLSSARNTALKLAFESHADLFAFLDDDEIPSENWLQSLLDCFEDIGTSAVIGPVEPLFESTPPQWVIAGDFFHKRCPGAGQLIEGYTSNVMMRTSAIAGTGVLFDEALNTTGGEDVVFFRALREHNIHVRCAPGAIAYESIPRSRATLSWMMRRWLRAGATSTLLMRQHNAARHSRLANIAHGLGRIGAGSVLIAFNSIVRGRRDFASVARSISTVCRGMGMLLAAFNISYQEYGQSYRRSQ